MKKKLMNICFIGCLMLLCLCKMNAQSPVWTLNKAIEEAQKNRKLLASLETESKINRLKTKELNAKYLPRVSLNYNYQYNPIIATSVLPASAFNSGKYSDGMIPIKLGANYTQNTGVLLQQPLLDISISKLITEYKLQEKLAGLNEKEARIELVYEVSKVYFNTLVAQEQVKEAIGDTTRTALSRNTISQKYSNSRVLKVDVNDAKVTHNNAVQKYHNAVNNVLVLKQYLLYITGNESLRAASIILEKYSMDENITDLDENLIHTLPQIEILKTQNEVLENKKKLEKAKHSPMININGYLGADQFTASMNPFQQDSWYGNSYIGVSLKLPLFFGENTAKRIGQLKLEQEQNNNRIIEDINKNKYNALNATTAYNNVLQQLKTVHENTKLTQEIVMVYQERYKFDQISFNELNDKEIQLQNLELVYNELQQELIVSWLDWKKATGKLVLQY
ncbi:TolC family protein [Flavobacterium pectinovorum]|uniref:TolC family protein n=1 Tax=Flavobacterium pectinovorum TaxID=29533 RepID=A0A502EG90_9FLAO|nr:TolC family protein [Flavobacterium pectinovorum]TPG36214.1 TolC family protein [Flavobacterium pectinovorum]